MIIVISGCYTLVTNFCILTITVFFQVIQKVWHLAIARVIFNEWKITTEQAKNQREYFEVN